METVQLFSTVALLAATLIVPPKGMGAVPGIAGGRAGIVTRPDVRILERYRGIATTKWGGHWYHTPFYIAVSSLNRDEDPAFTGMRAISAIFNPRVDYLYSMSCTAGSCTRTRLNRHMHLVQAQPLALCHGSRGWINKYTQGINAYTTVQVFARAGGKVYVASTRYDATDGDVFHAEKALKTLCPPGAAPPEPVDLPAQVRAPAGFVAVDPSSSPQIGNELDTRALWLRLSPKSLALQWMYLAQASDGDENITPQQESDFIAQGLGQMYDPFKTVASHAQSFCGVKDGWYRAFTGVDVNGYKFMFVSQYMYKDNESYALLYSRRVDDNDDGAAMASMRSFCAKP